jgi:fused signal recognition particle receptor
MLKRGIFKNFFQRTEQLLSGGAVAEAGTPITEELFENLEEALLGADMSLNTTEQVLRTLRQSVERERLPDAESVRERLRQTLLYLLGNPGENRLRLGPPRRRCT